MADRVPLRLRVALAFALTTAVALAGLGAFVLLRVSATFDERLDDTLEAQLEQLLALPADQRGDAAERVVGETFAQVLDAEGRVVGSSPHVVDAVTVAGEGASTAEVTVADDGPDETERETMALLVRRDGGQVLVVGTSRDEADEALAAIRTQLLVGGPVALAVAALLGYVVAGAGLRPIERMRARAATISDRSAGERLPLPAAHDELRRLAETLNAMLDRLDDGLRRQRRFVAEASHELRTPLALMRTELDLALSRPRTTEELTEALRSTDEEVRRLADLADRLLLLAAADSGRLPLDRERVDVGRLVVDVVRRFATAADESDRALVLAADDGAAVDADPRRLDQVVSNLVDNALRHGAGTVRVTVGTVDGRVTVTVADEGPGLGDRPVERFGGSRGGQGLGLAIVEEIVRAHGGDVTVAGAAVTVALPRSG